MKNIEYARDFLYICDYKGYFHGKTYFIHKVKGGYVASRGYRDSEKFNARTLKDLSAVLAKVSL
jgi:hypothetical protein